MPAIVLALMLAACATQQPAPPPQPEQVTITVALSVPARLVEMVADIATKDEVLGYIALAKKYLVPGASFSDDDQ